jgi:carboxymethylenebutenolidase
MKNIAAPVYGFYAGNDARITATVPDTKTAMAAAGKKYDTVIYDGAGHGFMRAGEDPTITGYNFANVFGRTDSLKRIESLLKGM